jgi:hypothetical protein
MSSEIVVDIVKAVGAIAAVVGPEIAQMIVAHGTETAPIPDDVRAQVRAILYPSGGNKLASEIEHDLDVAALADTKRGS